MQKFTTTLGWVLVIPFVAALALEIVVAGKVIFVADYNADQMGSIELAIGAILLAVTGAVALGGVVLIRRGHGFGWDPSYIAATIGCVGFVAATVIGGSLPVAIGIAVAGSIAGWFTGRRLGGRASGSVPTL